MKKYTFFSILILIAGLTISGLPAYATAIRSAASGNWNSTATWTPAQIPVSGDDVTIAPGHTITVTANAACNSISFTSSTTGTASSEVIGVNNGITLTVTNAIYTPGTAEAIKNADTYTLQGTGTINCASLYLGNSSAPSASGSTLTTLYSTLSNLNVTGNVTLTSTYDAGGNKNDNCFLDLQSGTMTVGGTISTSNANATYNSCRISTLNGLASGTLVLTGATPWNLSANATNTIELNGTGAIINYSYNGSQTILPTTYKNLKISGTGSKTTTGVTVNGSISVSGGAALSVTPTYSTPPSMEYTGNTPVTTGSELPSTVTTLTINNTGGVTLGQPMTITTLTIGGSTPGSVFSDGGFQITPGSSGTLNLTSGTLNLGSGSNATTFPNFATKNISTGTTVGYIASAAQTVSSAITYENLTLAGSGVKTTAGITVNKILSLQGTATASSAITYGASSTIEYKGSASQTTGNELPATFSGSGGIVINNANGVILNSSTIITNALTFTSGKFTLGSNNLTAGSTTGSSSTSYVVTNNTGSLKESVGPHLSITFPVGTATIYSPVTITNNNGSSDNFSSLVAYDATGSNSGNDRVKLLWTLGRTGSSSYTAQFQWPATAEGTNFTANRSSYSQLYNTTNLASNLVGTPVSGSGPYTLTSISTLNSNATYFIGNGSAALPVELISFTGSIKESTVTLNWTTATEVNNYGFNVERCKGQGTRDEVWEKIGFIQGHGNSNSPKSYSFADANPPSGTVQYRLKQIDFDGKYEYSDIVIVDVNAPANFSLNQNYPNPCNPTTVISYKVQVASNVMIKVFDLLGREVAELVNEMKGPGNYEVRFDGSHLASGIYHYAMSAGSFTSTKKMILMK